VALLSALTAKTFRRGRPANCQWVMTWADLSERWPYCLVATPSVDRLSKATGGKSAAGGILKASCIDNRTLIPSANSWRTPPSRPLGSRHSHMWAFDLRGVEGERPHPGRAHRRSVCPEDATDNVAARQHVVVFFVPLARGTAGGCAFEDEVVFLHRGLLPGRSFAQTRTPSSLERGRGALPCHGDDQG
jgi:hypothetical protein